MIIACIGYQRSGKTATAVLLSRLLKEKLNKCDLYSNIKAKDFKRIKNISEIIDNDNYKIVLIDEAYINFDSRKYFKNYDISLFINTLSKRKILLILTAPLFNMLDKRIREQVNYIIINVYDEQYLDFRIYDIIRNNINRYRIKKSKELWQYLDYDSKYIPDIVINDSMKY